MKTIDTTGWTRVLRNATLATCAEGRPYGLIPKGAVALAGNRVAWVGSKRDVPAVLPKNCTVTELNYALMTPGLIDCHTHLVWAGSRYKEFEQRVGNVSSSPGANTDAVRHAVESMLGDFTARDIHDRCPHASIDLVRDVLGTMRKEGLVVALRKGRGAKWRRAAPSGGTP